MYEIKDIYKQIIKFKTLKEVEKKMIEIEGKIHSADKENFYAIGYYSDLLSKIKELYQTEKNNNNGQLTFNF